MNRRFWLVLIGTLTWAADLRAQPVVGEVTAVGFRASRTRGTQYVAREGQWLPIQVRLSVPGSRFFQGQLRYECADLDGDLVSYIETPVTLTPDVGAKRAWCYAVQLGSPLARGRLTTLDIISDDGVLIDRLDTKPFELIRNDTMLILDVSSSRLTKLDRLQTPNWTPMEDGYGVRPYYRNVLVAAMPADELPDRWIGLEAVDVVVWNEPDPGGASIAQLQALKQWVRNGGQLVVGLGQSWPAVQTSELAEIVPVQPAAGGPQQRMTLGTRRVDQFFAQFVGRSYRARQSGQREFEAPIAVANVAAKPGALRAVRTQVDGGAVVDLITMQCVGSGRVIAVAASLRDLMPAQVPVKEKEFFAQLFELNPLPDELRESELESLRFAIVSGGKELLYDGIVRPISFAGAATVLVLAAFAFVVVYIGLATLASWSWLKRHGLTPLSWTVFAVFALVASAVSLGTVGVLRGVSRGVRIFSLVDLAAGSGAARARCYIGYSSPTRQTVDLSLAAEGAFLRPLTRDPGGTSTYATPQRYAALSARGLLQGTRMRATLKQFEGFWQGQVNGSIRAQLVADRETGEITGGSWIQNDLDVDLAGGYLLYGDPRFADDDFPTRAAGKTTNWWRSQTLVPPGLNVLAVWVPPIVAGKKVSGLAQEQYRQIRLEVRRWQQRADRKLEDRPDLFTLWDEQQIWVGRRPRTPLYRLDRTRRVGLDQTARAALLASTRSFYLHCKEDFEKVTNSVITTEGLMACDVSHWLMQGRLKAPPGQPNDAVGGQGILLLLADDPGPLRLHGGGKLLGPLSGRSLYRVRVPIGFQGRPPRELPGEFEP